MATRVNQSSPLPSEKPATSNELSAANLSGLIQTFISKGISWISQCPMQTETGELNSQGLGKQCQLIHSSLTGNPSRLELPSTMALKEPDDQTVIC